MKKGQTINAVVLNVHFPNRGVCRIIETPNAEDVIEELPKIRVKNVIPGQKVSVRVARLRHGKPEGSCLEILERAEGEYPAEDKEHVCPSFPACGGCAYQTLPYEKQLVLKENMARDLFLPVLGEERYNSIWEGFVESPVKSEYRNKMEFTFGDSVKDGPLELGMHRRGSFYDIVDASVCRIVDEDFRQAVTITRDYFREAGLPFFRRNSHEGYLRHLLVRKARKTGQILIDLVTTRQIGEQLPEIEGLTIDSYTEIQKNTDEDRLLAAWTERLKAASWKGQLCGVLHTKNDAIADIIRDDGTDILFGSPIFEEELLGLKFNISPFSFFQTNSLGAEKLYSVARDYILGKDSACAEVEENRSSADASQSALAGKTVFDLYSGTGTIAQILSPSCGHVVGVEIVAEAVEAAKENAKKNQITNCDFLCGDVLKVLDDIRDRPDMIVLDPPRDGIHPKAMPKLLAYGVDEMLYISCKPTSLARDLPAMMEAGYEPVRMTCVDMFVSTPNFETVCLLKKRK